ncbi:MAG: aminotransferase class I/II-fold pyridoxal phosphate-dependent enzyme, partial [Acidimicrobiaceae bacterium]
MTFDVPFCSPFDRPHLRHRTLAVSSISKSHALPGFRAGWVASHPDVTPRLVLVAEAMLFGSQPFIEDALTVALNERHPEVKRLRLAFRERAETLIKAFANSQAIERAVTKRTKVLLLNTPSNPTGAVLTEKEIDEIGAVCERHDLWIICDEVYADMTFDVPFCSPFDRPHLRHRTLAVSSISKSHALPGFRAGWVASHPDVT